MRTVQLLPERGQPAVWITRPVSSSRTIASRSRSEFPGFRLLYLRQLERTLSFLLPEITAQAVWLLLLPRESSLVYASDHEDGAADLYESPDQDCVWSLHISTEEVSMSVKERR